MHKTTVLIKGGIIKNLIKDQIKLIEPLTKNGTTKNIREYAISEHTKLNQALEDSNKINFIRDNKDIIINCCMSLYNKLNEDSRCLPTTELRELAKNESNTVMKIWKIVEKIK